MSECEICKSEKKVEYRKNGKELCLKCWKADISARKRAAYWQRKAEKKPTVKELVDDLWKQPEREPSLEDIIRDVLKSQRD